MPPVYLATATDAESLQSNLAAPVWYSTISSRRVPLLFDTPGNPGSPPAAVWRIVSAPSRRGDDLIRLADDTPPQLESLAGCAALALALTPLDKVLLDVVARHPLLDGAELTEITGDAPHQVAARLRQLARWKLLDARTPRVAQPDVSTLPAPAAEPNASAPPASPALPASLVSPVVKSSAPRYLLAENGVRYLTAVAGFQGAVRAYARARGWGRGFDALARHWEHTREENEFFLRLARIARRHDGHTLEWLSELESRLYYDSPRHRRVIASFLPDGRGVYTADGRRWDFAVEIERSRPAPAKIKRKLASYYACINANILRGEGIETLRIFVVMRSWERARRLRLVAQELATKLKVEPLPMYITTADLLKARDVDAPIWSVLAEPPDARGYCFECFVPKPKTPRPIIGTPRYIVS